MMPLRSKIAGARSKRCSPPALIILCNLFCVGSAPRRPLAWRALRLSCGGRWAALHAPWAEKLTVFMGLSGMVARERRDGSACSDAREFSACCSRLNRP